MARALLIHLEKKKRAHVRVIFLVTAAAPPMADASEGVTEAHEVNIPPYSDDEAQEIAVYRKMMKDDAKAAKRQRREQAVSDKEKAYDNSAVVHWLIIEQRT